MAANNNNKQQQLPPTQQLFIKFWRKGESHYGYLINNDSIGWDMGRPRKAPARIMTANLPISTWEAMDDLRLTNRSVWLNRVILDEIERENTNRDMYQERADASKKEMEIMRDPAAYLHEVADKQLIVAAFARIPENKKRLKADLKKYILEMIA